MKLKIAKLSVLLWDFSHNTTIVSRFLETDPESFIEPENYYKTEEQVFTALVGVYNTLSDTRGGSPLYGGDYLHQMGAEGEEGYYRHTPQRNIVGQFLYKRFRFHLYLIFGIVCIEVLMMLICYCQK